MFSEDTVFDSVNKKTRSKAFVKQSNIFVFKIRRGQIVMGLNMNNKFPFHSMMQASADRKTTQTVAQRKAFCSHRCYTGV